MNNDIEDFADEKREYDIWVHSVSAHAKDCAPKHAFEIVRSILMSKKSEEEILRRLNIYLSHPDTPLWLGAPRHADLLALALDLKAKKYYKEPLDKDICALIFSCLQKNQPLKSIAKSVVSFNSIDLYSRAVDEFFLTLPPSSRQQFLEGVCAAQNTGQFILSPQSVILMYQKAQKSAKNLSFLLGQKKDPKNSRKI